MKPRRFITGAEIEPLYDKLERRLDRLGLETQPEVAARILELLQDQDAPMRAYADAISADAGLCGRLLKLANSAHYGQRSPVTALDRALVVLGLSRVKALSIGFYLSRPVPGEEPSLSRRVWGESVYRAALSAALARARAGKLAAEAYVVGLMLDCAIPLMPVLTGNGYMAMYDSAPTPMALFNSEQDELEFTHVDLAAVLARRWRLPEVLATPIRRHHDGPKGGLGSRAEDPAALLHAIGYCAGGVRVRIEDDVPEVKTTPSGRRVLDLDEADLASAITDATREYQATAALFAGRAASIGNLETMAQRIQAQLIKTLDEHIESGLRDAARRRPTRFHIDDQIVEVLAAEDGDIIAYIAGANGERLISCVLSPGRETADTIRRKLGLEGAAPSELTELVEFVESLAAHAQAGGASTG